MQYNCILIVPDEIESDGWGCFVVAGVAAARVEGEVEGEGRGSLLQGVSQCGLYREHRAGGGHAHGPVDNVSATM